MWPRSKDTKDKNVLLGNMTRQRHMLSRQHTTYHKLPSNLLVVIPHKHNILRQPH